MATRRAVQATCGRSIDQARLALASPVTAAILAHMGCAQSVPERQLEFEGDAWSFYDAAPALREVERIKQSFESPWAGRVRSIPILPSVRPGLAEEADESEDTEDPAAGDECAICLGVLFQPVVTASCSHTFCARCWDRYRASAASVVCPCCRSDTTVDRQPHLDSTLQERYPRAWKRATQCNGLHGRISVDCPKCMFSSRSSQALLTQYEDHDVPPLVKIGFSNAGIADDASATLTYEGNADYGWKLRSIGGFALRGVCITDPKCLIETGVQRITERGGIKLVQGRGEAARVVASLCIDQRGVQSAYACDLPRSQPTTKSCAANRQHLCVSIKPQVRF